VNYLYKVTVRGPLGKYEVAYVVAPNPTSAYRAMEQRLNASGVGTTPARAMRTVELIAEESDYFDDARLILAPEPDGEKGVEGGER